MKVYPISVLLSNATAKPYLNGTLTATSFLGAPLLVFGDALVVGDPRWTAALDFADSLGAIISVSAPIIGVNLDVEGDAPSVRARLATQTQFYTPSAVTPFLWRGSSGAPTMYPICGPILCMASDEAHRANCKLVSGGESAGYIRTRTNNLYGIGNFACGPDTAPNVRLTPPVYDIPPATRTATLRRLLNLWRGFGGPTLRSSFDTLAALEGTRPGISAHIHPALVPYVMLQY